MKNEQIVKNEVLVCASGLIELLLNKGQEDQEISNAGYNWENIENLYVLSEDVINKIEELEEDLEKTEEQLQEVEEDSQEWYSLQDNIYEIEEELEELKNSDTEPQEILEWWEITNWLYEKLKENSEPVLSTDFGYYWGRTTTGQVISMDYIINKIANN